jgi:hypothetical protein
MILPIWHPRDDGTADLVVHGLRWSDMPVPVRRQWWRETDYSREPPSQEFLRQLPELMAAAKLELEADKREIAADTAAARELLRQARQPRCEDCLRPPPGCGERCLRSMLAPADELEGPKR